MSPASTLPTITTARVAVVALTVSTPSTQQMTATSTASGLEVAIRT